MKGVYFLAIILFLLMGVIQLVFADNIPVITNNNGTITVQGTNDEGTGTIYTDSSGNVLIQGTKKDKKGSIYKDPSGTYVIQKTDKDGNVKTVQIKPGNPFYNNSDGTVIVNPDNQYTVDNKSNTTVVTSPNNHYYIDNSGNYVDSSGNVIYVSPDNHYYVDNNSSVTVRSNQNYTGPAPYSDTTGNSYLSDVIFSDYNKAINSDYVVYGNQRLGRSGWELICQGYVFDTPVIISDIVISTIIFSGNSSGEIGLRIEDSKHKVVMQNKNYKKLVGKILPEGIYYFYPSLKSNSTKDCTLKLFLDKKI
ncbi:MAG TPA: hypothetical protein PL110_12430 [Candidatus Eremiobacteraeota bacterium]|nr:hypothetical protein [Candidatus Eremiobacteraeota bacterium]